MPPAARISDMHTCPLVNPGPVPHVGGPIITGCPTVLIGGMPAARVTDTAICTGPPDAIAKGSPTVLIGGLLAARIGDNTVHGGVIVMGCPTVMIGDAGSGGGGGGGAAPPVAPAAPAGPPTAAEILADPNVQEGMRQAWEDSDDGGPNDHEEGGYIVRNPDGSLEVVRVPTGDEDSLSFDIHPSGTIGDQEIVGSFHTHPNTGTTYDDEPSQEDMDASTNHPETMGPHQFVLSPNDVYHIDNSGNVSTEGSLGDVIGN